MNPQTETLPTTNGHLKQLLAKEVRILRKRLLAQERRFSARMNAPDSPPADQAKVAVRQNGHPSKSRVKFPFSSSFQTRILKLCLEQPEWIPALKPSYFDDPLEGQAFKFIRKIYQATQRVVSLKALIDMSRRELGQPATARVLRPMLKPLEDSDRAYLLAELPRFARFQAIGESLVEAANLYQQQDVDGLIKLVEKAAQPLPGTQPTIPVKWASDITMKRISWKWRHRLAPGHLHLFAGDPDQGKSLIACDLAARITTGEAWPGGAPGTGKGEVVLILSAEDSAEVTIKPRLVAAHADLKKVAIHDVSEASGISLVDDLAAVERTLVERQATVLIVDSLNDYIPRVKTSVANAMKEVLQRIARMANRLNLVVILISHFNKNTETTSPQYRVLDSVAIVAACRNIFYVVADPQLPGGHLVVHGKHNLGRAGRTLGYHIIEQPVKFPDGTVDKIGRLKWYVPDGRDIYTDDLLRPHLRSPRPNSTAVALIREHLKHGPILAKRILGLLKAAGVSKETAYRAKQDLKVRSEQRGRNRWFWFPPDWSKNQVTAWTPSDGQPDK